MNSEANLEIVLYTILGFLGTGILLSIILVIFVIWRIKKIEIPAGADFFEALRYTPLIIVITLDVLDFAFDFLSAPIGFTLLTFLGLNPLRGVAAIEAVIPGTQLIPLMTIAWGFVRIADKRGVRIPRI
ncbi:MAG: hypothetical protein ACERKX_11805 [Anaerolineales bacterium]